MKFSAPPARRTWKARILAEQAARLTQDVKRAVQRAAQLGECARLVCCRVAAINHQESTPGRRV